MYTPDGIIQIINVKYSSNYNHIFYFNSLAEQNSYFDSLAVNGLYLNQCNYIREENISIIVPYSIDAVRGYNYVRYTNNTYRNKWFYAFITGIDYMSPNSTKITLKEDVIQTWLMYAIIPENFIERLSGQNDFNTLSDSVATGKLTTVYSDKQQFIDGSYFVIYNSNPFMEDANTQLGIDCKIGTLYQPYYIQHFWTSQLLGKQIQILNGLGRSDRIEAAFYLPFANLLEIETTDDDTATDITDEGFDRKLVTSVSYKTTLEKIVNIPDSLFPNKKLMTYPYTQLEVINSIDGSSIILDLCKFDDPYNPSFKYVPVFGTRGILKVIPKNYNGNELAYEDSLIIPCDACFSFVNNSYAKYLQTQKNQNMINLGLTLAGGGASLMTGNVLGVVSTVGNVANIINSESQAKKLCNQSNGVNGDIYDYVNSNPMLKFNIQSCDSYHKNVALDFWNKFGYPIRKYGNINLTDSNNFVYVKTQNCSLNSNMIPHDSLEILENIFDKGVTVWKSPDVFNIY